MIGAIKSKKEDTLESLTDNFLKAWDLRKKIGPSKNRQVDAATNKLIKFLLNKEKMSIDQMSQYMAKLTVDR